jgi:DNA-binding NtrC family response regulator
MREQRNILLLGSGPDSELLHAAVDPHIHVIRAETGAEAIRALGQRSCDVILCQWTFADGDWRTFLENLRGRQLKIPVIVFCRCGNELEWVTALRAGAFDLLYPPYNSRQVMALIEHAAVSGRARKDLQYRCA